MGTILPSFESHRCWQTQHEISGLTRIFLDQIQVKDLSSLKEGFCLTRPDAHTGHPQQVHLLVEPRETGRTRLSTAQFRPGSPWMRQELRRCTDQEALRRRFEHTQNQQLAQERSA